MLISELLDGVEGEIFGDNPDADITGIAYDSRKVGEGMLFAALCGVHTDGKEYAAQAAARGAALILTDKLIADSAVSQLVVTDARAALRRIAENYYGRPENRLELAAITGTNGKTTIAQIIAHALRILGKSCGVLGTVAYELVSRSVPAPLTTPESPEFQMYLAEMVENEADYAVCEFSSQALAQERVAGDNVDYAVFTNLSRDHLDNHGDMENYFLAKKKLFDRLQAGAYAIVNTGDPYARRIVADTLAEVIRVGRDEDADFRIIDDEYDIRETRLEVEVKGVSYNFTSGLIGEYNVDNLLEAMAVLAAMGYDMPRVIAAVRDFSGAGGRLQRFSAASGKTVFVDYAHTDDALEKALKVLRKVTPGRLIVVFGCGGDRDRGKRPLMARAAEANADIIFMTNDNPRTEDPEQIMQDMLAGIIDDNRITVEYDRSKAIELAIETAGSGDVVLIAGKGHEDYQILGRTKVHFDDREIVAEILKNN